MSPFNKIVLSTSVVQLRPLEKEDYTSLFALSSQDETMWEYFSKKLSDPAQLHEWLTDAIEAKNAGTRLPFAIIEKSTGVLAGSSSIGSISKYDKRLEIGWSWLAPSFRGTAINMHAKFAMLRYAFEELAFERVEFKTGVLNQRARRGLEKIGGIEEGVLRKHSLLWNGNRRDTVYYSVLKEEWPSVKENNFKNFE